MPILIKNSETIVNLIALSIELAIARHERDHHEISLRPNRERGLIDDIKDAESTLSGEREDRIEAGLPPPSA